tara:strand:- start:718 stop:972 length:255 start_codon:yes stop_codon:yes gene_type:complete
MMLKFLFKISAKRKSFNPIVGGFCELLANRLLFIPFSLMIVSGSSSRFCSTDANISSFSSAFSSPCAGVDLSLFEELRNSSEFL